MAHHGNVGQVRQPGSAVNVSDKRRSGTCFLSSSSVFRYAFYSEGEDLGFLMYAYMSQLRLPSLEGLICHTKATTEAGVGAYAPCPQDKDTLSVFPSVSPDNQYMRFVVRGDFVCRRIRKPKGITRVEVTNLVTG